MTEEATADASAEATAEVGAEATVTATEEATTPPTPAVPPVASGEWEGMQVGFTAEGYPFRGEPNAPITMYEYSDYQCPFCARYFVQTEPAINENYVRTGKVRVVFRDFPIQELHPNAPAAHRASLCVAEQGADLYWAMHNKLFQTQTEWSNSTDPQPVFARLAEEAGADMDAYKQCMTTADEEKQPIIEAGLAAGQEAGVTGTPSFIFVGADGVSYPLVGAQPYDQFALYIDSMLAGEKPPVPEEQHSRHRATSKSRSGRRPRAGYRTPNARALTWRATNTAAAPMPRLPSSSSPTSSAPSASSTLKRRSRRWTRNLSTPVR